MERVAGYELLGEIGRGGAGTVYLARQTSLNRRVALKVVSTNDPELAARLLGEAQLLGELRHPSIIAVYDSGLLEGRPWYSMTYCGGGTLAQVLQRDGALTPGQVAGLAWPIADALASLHERGVVHRDVKPGNVLFDDNGSPYLGDFGTALDAKAERVTTSGAVLGTIGYTAPEMVSGGHPSPASDVFSLGVMAYEALAGVRPYAGSHIVAVIDAIRSGSFVPLAQAAPGSPPQMVALIEQALAVNPAARPADLRAWAAQLRATAKPAGIAPVRTQDDAGLTIGTVSNRALPAPTGPAVAVPRRSRNRTAMVVVGAVAALALMASGVLVLTGGDDAPSLAAEPEAGAVVIAQVDLPVKTANLTSASSTWTITEGADGPIVRGTTAITNQVTEPTVFTWDEVIPKELAADASGVESTPSPSSVVQADPILRYCLQLQPGAEAFISWRADVANTDLDQAALETLARAWSTEFDSHVANPGGEPCTADAAIDATTTTVEVVETVAPTTEAPPEEVALGQTTTVTTAAPRVATNTTVRNTPSVTTAAPVTTVKPTTTTVKPTTTVTPTTVAPTTVAPPPPPPVNQPPTAANDSGPSIGFGSNETGTKCPSNWTPLQISPLANDSDPEGGALTAVWNNGRDSNGASLALGGSVIKAFNSQGNPTICLTRSYASSISSIKITYRAQDPQGNTSDLATITIPVFVQ